MKSCIEPIYQEITFLESGGILGPKDKKKMQSRVRAAIKNFSKDGDVWKDEPKDKDEVDESSMTRPEKEWHFWHELVESLGLSAERRKQGHPDYERSRALGVSTERAAPCWTLSEDI